MSEEQRRANRLAGESSPYLLLHQHNPVDWYPWGEEALERARREEKPIFLSVGYSTCYWCHVMERESFSDETIAAQMNESFVNVKLDREERPDLDEIYMTATQVLTGHGGWPNSVFLTPELKPFFAGTYFPPEDRPGMPGFPRVLASMAEAWRSRREDIGEQAESVAGALTRYLEERAAPSAGPPDPAVAEASLAGLAERFDQKWGGFGGAPKFPTPSNLLLLEEFAAERPQAARMLTATLDQMARGGLYDQLAGGFHRYATDGEWKIPHFEKMLYDNGLLLELYAREWQRGGDPEMARVAAETAAFIGREMTAEDGALWSALDAETDGVEGAFYAWTREELLAVLGDEEFGFLRAIYGFDGAPFFEERHYVLHLPRPLGEQAAKRRMTRDELLEQLAPLGRRLLAAREERRRPLTDRKVLADWNGMGIAGLAEAGRLLPDAALVERAGAAATAVLDRLVTSEGLLHVQRGERPGIRAFLTDYAHLIHGLLALHRAGDERPWLARAIELAGEQIERLEDPRGGFFSAGESPEVLFRSKEVFDGAVPAANSVVVLNLLELYQLTGERRWLETAERSLAAFAGLVEKLPDGARTMALAARRLSVASPRADAAATQEKARGGSAPQLESPVRVRGEWLGEQEDDGCRGFKVVLEIEDGWHIYAREAAGFPGLEVATGEVETLDLVYPQGRTDLLALDGEPVPVHVGTVELKGVLRAPEGALLEVAFQPCESTRCLAPRTVRIDLPA